MTPHELNLHIVEYGEISKREGEESIVQAYLTAYWQRVTKMPKLGKVLEDSRPKKPAKPQTPEQMLEETKRLHAKIMNDK